MPAWTFDVGHRSSGMPRAISSDWSAGSSTAPGPCAIRSGAIASARRTCSAPPHSPAWTVRCKPDLRAASNARAWSGDVRGGGLRAGQVEPGQAVVDEARRGLGEGRHSRPGRGCASRWRSAGRRSRCRPPPGAPRGTPPPIPESAAGPCATWSSGAQRISTYRTPSAALSSTSSAATRSSASASCIRAMAGRRRAAAPPDRPGLRRDERPRAWPRASWVRRRGGCGRARARSTVAASRRGGGGARTWASRG